MWQAGFCRLVISLGAFLALCGTTEAVEPDTIRAVLDAQVAAWNRGDIDAFMEGYARSSKTARQSGSKSGTIIS